MKTALLKDIFREIKHTLPRFFSIMLMISLGVFVYTGLKGAAPLMINTVNDFTAQTNMADIKVEAAIGLNRKDISIINSHSQIKYAEWIHSVDLNTRKSDLLIQIQSLPEKLSVPYLVKGRLPIEPDEILLDAGLEEKGYEIGEIIHLKKEISKFNLNSDEKKNALRRYQYRIVGFCHHPEFIHPSLKGEANGGLGQLKGFAFVRDENFTDENYQAARLRLKDMDGLNSDDYTYKEKSVSFKNEMEALLEKRPKIRLRDIRQEAQNKILENEQKLEQARRKLDDASILLDKANKDITDGEEKLAIAKRDFEVEIQKAKNRLHNADSDLSSANRRILEGQHSLALQSAQLEQAQKEYEKAHREFNQGKQRLNQEEERWKKNSAALEDGLQKVEKGLLELRHAENLIRENLKLLSISPDIYKERILSLLQQKQFHILEKMGPPAMQYADILEKQEALRIKKTELTAQRETLEKAMKYIQKEKDKMMDAEQELQAFAARLNSGKGELNLAEQTLKKARKDYDEGIIKLKEARDSLFDRETKANSKILSTEEELKKARKAYDKSKEEYDEKKAEAEIEIADGKEKIRDAKRVIRVLKESSYKVLTREDFEYYFIYYDSAIRIELLSNIFPVFFFLIAMLVCLSTMTRMAEEQRGQIGTLKALGYGNWDVAKKYFYYGLISSTLGGIIGIYTGQPILSKVVFGAYSSTFVIKEPLFNMAWRYNIYSMLIGIACTAVVAFLVVTKHLRQHASALMRPKAPKGGTKIALERITFLWKRMSFLQKVTARNMFRYKIRMSMTILGIAGCTGLVFLGFSLRDSVSHLLPVQYNELMKYQYLVIYDEDLSEKETKRFKEYLSQTDMIEKSVDMTLELATWKEIGYSMQTVQILTPKVSRDLAAIHHLRKPLLSDSHLELSDDAAVISEKLAKLAGVQAGDYIEIKDVDNKKIKIKINAVAENYIGHFLYFSTKGYHRYFGKNPVMNSKALILNPQGSISTQQLVSDLLDFDIVLSVSQTRIDSAIHTLDSLDIVVGIMIFVSSLLAFVVLYNLTNINISERTRELSTIKVLGFYPKEVTAYVYRETLFLSFIGIGLGYGFGGALHKMILQFIVPDAFQLYPKIFWSTYVISAVMTLIFSLVVMIFVHFRLGKINMVEALKSYS